MTEKVFPLGNFLIKLDCKFINRNLEDYQAPMLSALYTMSFCTQDNMNYLASIPMNSEVFFDIVDIFRWCGIDGAFMYAFPPAKLFEQYCLCIGYIDDEDQLNPTSPIEFCLFKSFQVSPNRMTEETVFEAVITQDIFDQFVEFLIDYAYCAEGHT